MPEQPSARELMEKRDALTALQDTIEKRMVSFSSPQEKAKADSPIKRAFDPYCEFDRKHTIMLITLAISPHEVSWHFKLRERIHRLLRLWA